MLYRTVIQIPFALIITSFIGFFCGCISTGSGPYATQSYAARNPLEAQRLTMHAAPLMETDPEQAQQLLNEALTADIYHGPAHNNLGVIYLGQGKLYEAANEFEWARKLMPGHPDPRMNLALTLEKAGRFDEALKTYETALEVYPEHVPTIQAIASLRLRHDRPDDRTRGYLERIARDGQSQAWRSWAQFQLAKARDSSDP